MLGFIHLLPGSKEVSKDYSYSSNKYANNSPLGNVFDFVLKLFGK